MGAVHADEFYPKAVLRLDQAAGLDERMDDAIVFKYIGQRSDQRQLYELLLLPHGR